MVQKLFTRHINNYAGANQCNCCSYNIIFIRFKAIYLPGPQQRHYDEDAAVGCVNPAEICRLPGGYDTVKHQHQPTDDAVPNRLI